jgi:polyisoprenoid-binding protein YceI
MSSTTQPNRTETIGPAPRRKGRKIALLTVIVLLSLVGAGAVWFLSGDAPASVDISAAVEQVAPAPGSSSSQASGDGTWTVDTTVGTFSVTESTGTFVGVRVDEELANIGATTAVVRTPAVAGTIALEGTTLSAATIEADLAQLVSDEPRREMAVHRALDTQTHPTATFDLTDPVQLDALPTADAPVEAIATGELTIAGVTNRVEVPLQAALVDDVAVVTASFDVTFADYGVQVPTAPIVVSAEDHGTVELQLFLTRS